MNVLQMAELIGHGRAAQRSEHSCLTITAKTPSVSTLFGKNAKHTKRWKYLGTRGQLFLYKIRIFVSLYFFERATISLHDWYFFFQMFFQFHSE